LIWNVETAVAGRWGRRQVGVVPGGVVALAVFVTDAQALIASR
jgi:hypothetical protein